MDAAAVEELVTCSICLDKIERPKMIPCQHSFCYTCLLSLAPANRGSLECPNCRVKHYIPRNGIDGFQDNFLINNLLDLLDSEATKKPTCCYCESEVKQDGMICDPCASDPRLPVTENIQCKLVSLRSHLSNPQTISNLARNEKTLHSFGEDLVRERDKMVAQFDDMITALQNRKSALNEVFGRAATIQKLVLGFLDDQVTLDVFCDEIRSALSCKPELEELQRIEEKCLKHFNWYNLIVDITRNKKKFFLKYHRPNVMDDEFDNESIKNWISTLGTFTDGTVNFDELNGVDVGQLVPERPVREGSSVKNEPKASTSNSDNIGQGTSLIAGPSGPISSVNQAPRPRGNLAPIDYNAKSFRRAQKLGTPHSPRLSSNGIAYSARDDSIFCADAENNRIVKIRGTKSKCQIHTDPFGSVELSGPWDVAVSDFHNSIVISDAGHHRIVCLNGDGNLKFEAGSFGRGKDKLRDPRGITVYRDSILVVDRGNRRISVFNIQNGSSVRNFGQKHLISPSYMAVQNSGKIYVTDARSSYPDNDGLVVRTFDWNGKHIGDIFGDEIRPSLMLSVRNAAGITVDNEGFVCTGNSRCLLVIDSQSGQIRAEMNTALQSQAIMLFDGIRGLELMPNGRLIVSDAASGALMIL